MEKKRFISDIVIKGVSPTVGGSPIEFGRVVFLNDEFLFDYGIFRAVLTFNEEGNILPPALKLELIENILSSVENAINDTELGLSLRGVLLTYSPSVGDGMDLPLEISVLSEVFNFVSDAKGDYFAISIGDVSLSDEDRQVGSLPLDDGEPEPNDVGIQRMIKNIDGFFSLMDTVNKEKIFGSVDEPHKNMNASKERIFPFLSNNRCGMVNKGDFKMIKVFVTKVIKKMTNINKFSNAHTIYSSGEVSVEATRVEMDTVGINKPFILSVKESEGSISLAIAYAPDDEVGGGVYPAFEAVCSIKKNGKISVDGLRIAEYKSSSVSFHPVGVGGEVEYHRIGRFVFDMISRSKKDAIKIILTQDYTR